MPIATDQYLLLRAFVDELARCGLRHACTSPGSRSAPLVLSLAREPRLQCHSHIDERSAGFFALGVAKASGSPAAVACTSGTAAAELAPAVAEACGARVPLLVLTADRPPELREVGAGQTIDQIKLYGDAAKWFFEVGTHEATPSRLRWMRTLACRAWATATEGRPGVVHLNFALREPLLPAGPLPDDDSGRADGAPFVVRRPGARDAEFAASDLRAAIGDARRGVVVAGRDERANGLGQAAAAFAQALGWPLLADPLSGARRGAAAVAHYDALLRDADFVGAHVPDLILRVGDLPPSKPLRVWLSGLSAVRQVALDPEGAWQDPSCVLWGSLEAEPASTLARLAESPPSPAPQEWLSSWRAADGHAAGAISRELEGAGLSEPAVAAELARLLPPHAILFVASSMPVRDVETFWPVLADPPRVLCNRAANGIDGTVASALGAAAGSEGPVVLLIGDVAIAHDVGSLLAARRLSAHLTVVCLNNEGGGIFDFLDVAGADIARQPDIYSEHIATPPGLDLAAAAQLAGAAYEQPLDVAALRAAITRALASAGGLRLIEVRTQRPENVALHRRLWAAVATAVASPRPVLSRPIPRT